MNSPACFRPLFPALLAIVCGTLSAQDFPEDQTRPNWVAPRLQLGDDPASPVQLFLPRSVAFGKEDRVLVADTGNHRVQEYSAAGKPMGTWGRRGSGPGEFLFPAAVAVSGDGEVFVADTGNDRIQVLDGKGAFLRQWRGELKAPVALASARGKVAVVEAGTSRVQVFTAGGEPVVSFGSHGSTPGAFREPAGIAIDDEGHLYVSDSGNHRIQKFSPKGEPLLHWGSWGAYRGFLSSPSGIACSGNRLYVADSANHRVQVFDRSGAFLYQWGRHPTTPGEAGGRLHYPTGVAVSPSGGFTAVCETLDSRLQVFANGSARKVTPSSDLPWWDNLHVRFHARAAPPAPASASKVWTRPPPILAALVEPDAHAVLFFDVSGVPSRVVARAGTPGSRLGEFSWPSSVVRHPVNGRYYVCDRGNRRIQILDLPADPAGATGFAPWVRFIGALEPGKMVPGSVAGYRPEWSSPEALAFDSRGTLYVADAFNAAVLVFDPEGRFARAIRLPESRKGMPARFQGVAADPDGKSIYVINSLSGEILGFTSSGELRSAWGGATGTPMPGAIAVDAAGSVFATDLLQRNVKRFDSKGQTVAQWGMAGRQQGHLFSPEGITFLKPDLLIVDDFGNHCGHVASPEGRYVQMIMRGGDVAASPAPR